MGEVNEGPDSIRLYHTGAASHGDAQTDPLLSIGGNLSSTEVKSFKVVYGQEEIGSLDLDWASGPCGEGQAWVRTPSVDKVTFAAPGEGSGVAVAILNGETKTVHSTTKAKYARITRVSANPLSGVMPVELVDSLGAVLGPRNATAAEASSGQTLYRGLGLQTTPAVEALRVYLVTLGTARTLSQDGYGVGAITIRASDGTFDDWPARGYVLNKTTGEVSYYAARSRRALTIAAADRDIWGSTTPGAGIGDKGASGEEIVPVPPLEIAVEAPASQPSGAITVAASETTAPVGVSPYSHPIDYATGVSIGALAAGDWYGVWIKRLLVAGTSASPVQHSGITWQFDISL